MASTVVRSINLKLVVPRNEESKYKRQSLWETHAAVNEAVRYYEQQLLLMRGQGYQLSNEESVKQRNVRKNLEKAIRKAQERNGIPTPGNNVDELCDLLRGLYEHIVPSSVGKDGNAQQANAYLSPLTDSLSTGFLDIFEKLSKAPDWLEGIRNGEEKAFNKAQEWIESPAGMQRLGETGAPPKWKKLYKAGDPLWAQAFLEDIDRKKKEIEGAPRIICQLMEYGVLPFFEPFFSKRINGYSKSVSRWDRLSFRLAVGHLLSWESWCAKSAVEHASRKERVENFKAKHLTSSLEPSIEIFRRYEKERHDNELTNANLPIKRPFRITRRQIRGWDDLREKWLKDSSRTYDSLKAITSREQTRLQGRFGDPHLFLWMAKPENHGSWDSSVDALSLLVRLNAMQSLLEKSRETAIMTLPEPIKHPRSVQWEALGGSNLKNHHIGHCDKHGLFVSLPLLCNTQSGNLQEVTHEFSLASSGQFRNPRFTQPKKKTVVRYQAVLDEEYQAEIGAADLLMNWTYLQNRQPEVVAEGDIGPVYLKLSLDIEQILPSKDWPSRRPPAINHFLSAKGNNKHLKNVEPGLRILSVDLGVRSFAACSVFELARHKADKSLSYPIDDLGLWANHERSFVLELPGEDKGKHGKAWQTIKSAELRDMRRTLGRYRKLYSLFGLDPDVRKSLLEAFNAESEALWDFEKKIHGDLLRLADAPPPLWDGALKNALKAFRYGFGDTVRLWRRGNRAASSDKYMGKSMWAIQHLQDTRRFLFAWSHLGRYSGDIRRADREKRGVFAYGLLDHLDNVREDRLKTGSDLLVQAARGYLRNKKGEWQHAYSPCHAILFEDLSRYLMLTDRPRRENSQLMKWAHRAVPGEVEMQGQLYGINVCDTSAAFSSRYHARYGTPGIRCHALKEEDFQDQFFREVIERENAGINLDEYCSGDLVPLGGGKMFVSYDDNGGLSRIHADINAAQNLQRRFWSRHGDAFRLPCRKVTIDGQEAWVPRSFGKRVHGALGGYGYLLPTGDNSGSCTWQQITLKKWKALASKTADNREEKVSIGNDEEQVEIAALEEEALELSNEYMTFFRDPSGITLAQGLWFPTKTFWGMVKSKVQKRMTN